MSPTRLAPLRAPPLRHRRAGDHHLASPARTRRLLREVIAAALIWCVLAGCTSGDPAALERVCAQAEALASTPPWPPPDSGALEMAVRESGERVLIALAEEARDHRTDHERIVSPTFSGIAPSEARAIASRCEELRGDREVG